MTQIEHAVRARLAQHGGVIALVADRIEKQPLAQGSELPAITYLVISGTLVGRAIDGSHRGLQRLRIQIDCWASTPDVADELELQVMDALDGFRGLAGDRELLGAFWQNVRDQHEADVNIYRKIADYFVTAAA